MQPELTVQAISFNKVLLATDFTRSSDAAFSCALEFCASLHADLFLLHVSAYPEVVLGDSAVQLIDLDRLEAESEQRLADLAQQARNAGVSCQTTIRIGSPVATILDAASVEQVDLVILGTNAFHGLDRLVSGSVAEGVLRKARCPVITVGPLAHASRVSESDHPIVFATDFHETTCPAVRYAEALCKALKAPLHCLHILPGTLKESSRSKIIPQIMTEALQHVARDGGKEFGDPICAVTYGSAVPEAIDEYLARHHARLLVLGVRQASLLTSHLKPHITYSVIAGACCPVLTIAFPAEYAADQRPPQTQQRGSSELTAISQGVSA